MRVSVAQVPLVAARVRRGQRHGRLRRTPPHPLVARSARRVSIILYIARLTVLTSGDPRLAFSRHPLCPSDAHRVVRVDDARVHFRRNSARPCKMMVLHDVCGRDARHEARRATERFGEKSESRAPSHCLVGWIELFCEVSKNPTVLVGWEIWKFLGG